MKMQPSSNSFCSSPFLREAAKLSYPTSGLLSADKEPYKFNLLTDTTFSPILNRFKQKMGFNSPLAQHAEIFVKSMNAGLKSSKSITDPVYVNPNSECLSTPEPLSVDSVSDLSVENLNCILNTVSSPTSKDASTNTKDLKDQDEEKPSSQNYDNVLKKVFLLQNEENELLEEKRKLASDLQTLIDKEFNLIQKRNNLFKELVSKISSFSLPLPQETNETLSSLPKFSEPNLETSETQKLETKRKNVTFKDNKLVKKLKPNQNVDPLRNKIRTPVKQPLIQPKTLAKDQKKYPKSPIKSAFKESASTEIKEVSRENSTQPNFGTKNFKPFRSGMKPKPFSTSASNFQDSNETKRLELLKRLNLRKTFGSFNKGLANTKVDSNRKGKTLKHDENNETKNRLTKDLTKALTVAQHVALEKKLPSKTNANTFPCKIKQEKEKCTKSQVSFHDKEKKKK